MRRAALAALVLGTPTSIAHAEGEQTPMFGGSVIGSQAREQPEVAGVQLEMAVWRGRIGIAIEGSQQWSFEREDGPRVTAVAGSARLLVFRGLMQSLIEPRDVEFGLELHGVVERSWWQDAQHDTVPVRYGAGVAVRLRGGGDDFSNLLAESRLFVRVMTSRRERGTEIAARDMVAPTDRGGGVGVMIGLGAAWGGGTQRYIDRFRPRPLDTIVDGKLIRLH